MSDIDLVLEKWLTAFKKYGHTLEIYENPSMKEFSIFKDRMRFILDSKRQKIYAWSATGAIHSDAWIHIKKEINDARLLYKSGTLLTGVVENSSIYFFAATGLSAEVRQKLKSTDWSFAKRWVDMDTLNKALTKL